MATVQSSSPVPPTIRVGDQEGNIIKPLKAVMPLQVKLFYIVKRAVIFKLKKYICFR